MLSTWMWPGAMLAMVAVGCGGSGSMQADSAVTPAPVGAPEAPVKARTGMKLGIGFTANVLGELEPCG